METKSKINHSCLINRPLAEDELEAFLLPHVSHLSDLRIFTGDTLTVAIAREICDSFLLPPLGHQTVIAASFQEVTEYALDTFLQPLEESRDIIFYFCTYPPFPETFSSRFNATHSYLSSPSQLNQSFSSFALGADDEKLVAIALEHGLPYSVVRKQYVKFSSSFGVISQIVSALRDESREQYLRTSLTASSDDLQLFMDELELQTQGKSLCNMVLTNIENQKIHTALASISSRSASPSTQVSLLCAILC